MLGHKSIGVQSSFKKKRLCFWFLVSIFPVLLLGLAASHLFSQQIRQEVQLQRFLDGLELNGTMKIYVIDDKGRTLYSSGKNESGTASVPAGDLCHYWLESAKNGDCVAFEELTKKSGQMKGTILSITGIFMLSCMALTLFGIRGLFRELRPFDNEIEALDAALQRLISANKHLHDEIEELMPLAKERIYQLLINGELDESEASRLSERLELPLNGSFMYVGIVQVDDSIRFYQTYRERERSAIHEAMRKAIEELCEDTIPCVTFIPEPGQVAVLFVAQKTDDHTFGQICQVIKQFRAYAANCFRFTLSAAVSDVPRDCGCIHAGYRDALHALSYRLLYGPDVTITTETIRQRGLQQSEESMFRPCKSIVLQLLQGHAEAAAVELGHWLEGVRHNAPSSENAIGLIFSMLGVLEYKLNELGSHLGEIVSYDFYGRLRKMTVWTEVQEWLLNELFPAVAHHLELVRDPKSIRVVRQVEAYLQERYDEEITLQLTADRLGISPSFLSRIFKESTGRSFSDYLLDIRMNKAMEWLAFTDWSLQYISERLCYSNAQNFSRIFKKTTGAAPGEYRKMRQGGSRSS